MFWRPVKSLPTIPASNLRETQPVRTVSQIHAWGFSGAADCPSRSQNLLSSRDDDALREISIVVEFRRSGLNVFSEGENANFLYAIDDGIVRIVRHAENGQRQILAFPEGPKWGQNDPALSRPVAHS